MFADGSRAPKSGVNSILDRRAPCSFLLAVLIALLGLQQLLLWRFIGFGATWLQVMGALAVAAICATVNRLEIRVSPGPSLRLILGCGLVALLLFLLGGQGDFFYSNPDWIVRDAVLRDMVMHPWPYAYTDRGEPEILRAPIAMYLLPALAGKAAGLATANIALLAQNSFLLAALLALGSTLFARTGERCVALLVFLFFSGLDILGKLFNPDVGSHLEQWAGVQFSSHITQAFWVPHHALAGWIGGLLYLLWRDGRLNPATLLTAAPLLALWSPLALIGLMPFAIHTALDALARRQIGFRQIALPGAATILALPSLFYLIADGGEVGARLFPLPWPHYVIFELLEAVPFLVAAYLLGGGRRFGAVPLAIAALVLFAVPYGQIGYSVDLPMRASIPALAILSIMIADVVIRPAGTIGRRVMRMLVIALLALGAVTPLSEIRRSLAYPPSPPPLCNVFGAAMAGFGPIGVPIYLARVNELPLWLRPAAPTILASGNPSRCWDRPWPWPPRMADQFK